MVFLRVQTSVFDPLLIGDKPKWYAHQLQAIEFKVYDESSTLGSALNTTGETLSDEYPTGNTVYLINTTNRHGSNLTVTVKPAMWSPLLSSHLC